MPYDDKKMKLKEANRCFRCTRLRHTAKTCKANIRCKICRKWHATSMCRSKELIAQCTASTPGEIENLEEKTSTCQFMNLTSNVFLQTAVELAEGRRQSCCCHVLLNVKASLEKQYSQEKTALLSEQMVRTKELLSKHREEVEQLEKTVEARLADERRRMTEELHVLRCSLREKEQALRRCTKEQQAKASAEMAELINKHGEVVRKLSSALEVEQKKTESLRSALDSLKKETDKIVELAERITRASLGSTVEQSTAIRRLAEENATLRREAEAARAEYESMLSEEKSRLKDQVETVHAGYELTLQNLEEKLRGTEVDHRRHLKELLARQKQYQEEVKLKDEELLLLKHAVEEYADTLGSQRLKYYQELENIERSLEAKHAAEIESLKSEHRENIEVLIESLQRELLNYRKKSPKEQAKEIKSNGSTSQNKRLGWEAFMKGWYEA
ncbi:uncharacterized protein LOC142578512 [Dermacentor variabilis]|uniref:uncharacterized protein LOC142578512 n=1 Tax=Dermacentor variabilis TaxID=34621 RepID=UPI003F5BF1C4